MSADLIAAIVSGVLSGIVGGAVAGAIAARVYISSERTSIKQKSSGEQSPNTFIGSSHTGGLRHGGHKSAAGD